MKKEIGSRISQCMIVKNEEQNIERALSWGKDIMWEQIVVDTGSTDRTVELARKLGAKVLFFQWIDDFAAAKNFAVSQAKGDWIAFLDADEYLSPEGVKKAKVLLDDLLKSDFDGIAANWQNLDQEGNVFAAGTQTRFFRNAPNIRYCRRIHEYLTDLSGGQLKIGDATQEIAIYHTGYQGKGFEEKKKSKRNYKLILEELKENPDDAEMMGYMGDEYYNDGDMEEAEKWLCKAISHMSDQLENYDQRSAFTFTRLMAILAKREGICQEDIESVYRQAVKLLPQEPDFDYIFGRYFAETGQAACSVEYLEKALKKLELYGCGNKAFFLAGDLLNAYDLLVRCCFEIGDQQKCISYGVSYLQCAPYGMSVLSRLLRILLQSEQHAGGIKNPAELQAVLQFLSKIYNFSSLKDKLFVVKAAEKSDCQNFADYMADCLLTSEEKKMLGYHKG